AIEGMSGEPLEIGIVGAGAIASSYVEAVAASSEATVVAVADTDVHAAAALAGRFDCQAYDSHEAMVSGIRLDAAVICTPPSSHCEIALHLLGQGIPVLCEKPLTPDITSATQLLAAAEQHGVLLTMAAKFRFVDDVIAARNILRSGILGEVILFENAFTSRVDMSGRWNAKPDIAGGGVLIDNGTHSVDIVRYFLGPIAEVLTVEGKRIQNLEVEDTVRVFLHSAEGVMGSVDLSWSIDKSLEHFIQIYGSKGEIRVGWRRSSFRQVSSGEWVEFGSGYRKVDAMRGALDNFCRAVRGREPLLITATDALASVGVVDAAYRSLEGNGWVSAPPERVLPAA
ncbi:MAG TPA: Gfo/Idh/MocA family oxidoreductase, partial [Acidimicrobiales bacterium]|nr:Gfo/Idh/MocA family oxidoreductase [Acidimicrobiales bacterium]